MVNLNLSLTALNVQSLSAKQGIPIDVINENNSNNSINAFKGIMSDIMLQQENSRNDIQKAGLAEDLIANQKLHSALYKAVSALFIMDKAGSIAVSGKAEIAQDPVVKAFAQGLSADEKNILYESIKAAAVQLAADTALGKALRADLKDAAFDVQNNKDISGNNKDLQTDSKDAGASNRNNTEIVNTGSVPQAAEQKVLREAQNAPVRAEMPAVPDVKTQAGKEPAGAGAGRIEISADTAKSAAFVKTEVPAETVKEFAAQLNRDIMEAAAVLKKAVSEKGPSVSSSEIKEINTQVKEAVESVNKLVSMLMPSVSSGENTFSAVRLAAVENRAQNSVVSVEAQVTGVPPKTASENTPEISGNKNILINTGAVEQQAAETASKINGLAGIFNGVLSSSAGAGSLSGSFSADTSNNPLPEAVSGNIRGISVNTDKGGNAGDNAPAAQQALKQDGDIFMKIASLLKQLNGRMEIIKNAETAPQEPMKNTVLPEPAPAVKAEAAPASENAARTKTADGLINTKPAETAAREGARAAAQTSSPETMSGITAKENPVPAAAPENTENLKLKANAADVKNAETPKEARPERSVNPAPKSGEANAEKNPLVKDMEWLVKNMGFEIKNENHLKTAANNAVFENLASFAKAAKTDIILKQVSEAVAGNALSPKTTEIKMFLRPENLGIVIIKLETADKKVNAKIQVAGAEAREILRVNTAELRASLGNAGVDIENIEISMLNSDGRGDFEGSFDEFAQWEGGALNDTALSGLPEADGTEAVSAPFTGYLNYFA
ncbi:MAG: flagellar hook-length control protein FliK [Candidatus Goldiibacteriota bacterium]